MGCSERWANSSTLQTSAALPCARGTLQEVPIARSLKRTIIAIGITIVEAALAVGRLTGGVGQQLTISAHAFGGRFVRVVIPFYRAWWTVRRIMTRSKYHGADVVLRLLASRSVVYVMFTVAVLSIASQTLHAREYGGFVGKRPLLVAFFDRNTPEVVEEVIAGPAIRVSSPAFRAASVNASLQPTVLGAEANVVTAPPTSGFSVVQPILTDTAVEDSGRKGIEEYTVQSGDTPSTIAEQFGLQTATILWENKLSSWSVIRPGQQLRILPTDGVVHIVRRGDTLEKIADRYRANAEETLEFNRLVDADDIDAGDVLIVPGGRPPEAPKPVPLPVIVKKDVPKALPSIPGKFFWPSVSGYRISQYFTWRHHAIDIAVSQGTSIFASEGGTIVSSGWVSGYGYQVLIDHGNGLKTRYAHASRLLVAKGETIQRGQQIALVGSTGRSTGPHIHYEIYAHGTRVNPLQYVR